MGMLALTPATYAVETISPLSEIAAPWDNIQVKGVVVDESGSPLPGVSVYVKGTTNGTITDIDGNFSINVESNATLVFSFVGFTSQEIAVNGRSSLGSITMQEDNKEIEQVVVIGYGTQKKVDLTGSVAVVDADEMKKVSNSNISSMLEGKVAGVQITSDGQPGADPSVRIRGIGSFGSTAPLYVIDGVPVGTTIRDFSPNDIASIQILKDASAAAIYGSRAGNGVVIITTKSGKKNQPMKVDYSGYVGIDMVNQAFDVMETSEFIPLVQQACANSGAQLPSGYDVSSSTYLGDINTNWFDECYKIGVRQNHNVSLSGGGENSTYNIGLDYFDQKGTIEGSGPDYKRYTVRINNTMDVKFLKLKTGIVYSHSDQNDIATSNTASDYVNGFYGNTRTLNAATYTVPTMLAYDESTWCLDESAPQAKNWHYDAYGYGTYYLPIHGDISNINPLLINNLTKKNGTVDRVLATASVNVDLFKMFKQQFENHKLSYNLNLSYNKTYCKDSEWLPAFYQSERVRVDKDAEYLWVRFRNNTDALIENTICYEGTIADKNHINFVIGQTFEQNDYQDMASKSFNFPEPYYLQINQGSKSDVPSTYQSQHVITSYIGRLNYDYDSKYLLSATVRRDGSSRLSKDDRWGVFPSISLGWRLDREEFFPVDDRLVNLLKIRGSYGVLGNENIGEYRFSDTMDKGQYPYSFGGTVVAGSVINKYIFPTLLWEKKKSTNVGVDLGMLSGQIEFSAEYYKNVSEDLLYEVPVPAAMGATNGTAVKNAGSMENSGLEFTVSYHNYKHALKYDVSANLSTLKNKVTSLGGGDGRFDASSYTIEGQEIGQFYGYVYEGIYQSQEQIDNHVNALGEHIEQLNAAPGDCAYADISGPEGTPDGKIDTYDRTFLGSGLPKINFGLSGRIEYKNFDLSVSTFGALKFMIDDALYGGLISSYGIGANRLKDLSNAWTPENPSTTVPRVQYEAKGENWNDKISSRYLQKGNYWKIANVEIGYNFKDAWFKGVVTGVRAYVSGQNLATLTKYKGYNVDFAGGTYTPGFNLCSYPTPRTFMFGVRASF